MAVAVASGVGRSPEMPEDRRRLLGRRPGAIHRQRQLQLRDGQPGLGPQERLLQADHLGDVHHRPFLQGERQQRAGVDPDRPDRTADTPEGFALTIRLRSGQNTIKLFHDSAPAPDLDRIVVSPN